ncbi:putative TOM core complex subunit Tom6 [Thermoascus aurantiacus ATCC 26904]
MAPKQRVVVTSGRGRHGHGYGYGHAQQQQGFLSRAYRDLTSSENATIVRSVLAFGAAVAFLHSSLSEFLLPP